MGVAIDTVVFSATNPGPTVTAASANSGDSLSIRAFGSGAFARIDWISRQGATSGIVGLRSPRMHDNTRGLRFVESETPAVKLLPPVTGQQVYPADTLIAELTGGTAEVDAGAFGVFYSDLGGSSARLTTWDAISGVIANLVAVEVDVSAQATSAGWSDTGFTATEDLLKADTAYAVLGYTADTACLAIGIKGPETGNYRLCGPGPTATFDTADYFVVMSQKHGAPYIPVINANNRKNLSVCTALVSTAATPKIDLILAELAAGFGG